VTDPVELSGTRVRTDDWPAQATDTIVKIVGTANDKVVGPVKTTTRALVFGLFAAILGVAALVLLSILVVRVMNNYLPDAWFGKNHVWAVYLILGGVFMIGAAALWRKTKPRTDVE
jgi:hypothetical protein